MRDFFQNKHSTIILSFLTLFNSGMALCQETFTINSTPSQSELNGWKEYAENLKTCTAGDFNVTNPITKDQIQYKIVGLKENKCEVVMKMPASGSYPSQKAVYNCQFEADDLKTLADRAEQLTKGGPMVINSEGPFIKIMNKSCKKTGLENNGNFVPIPESAPAPTNGVNK